MASDDVLTTGSLITLINAFWYRLLNYLFGSSFSHPSSSVNFVGEASPIIMGSALWFIFYQIIDYNTQ